ncbi:MULTISPECIES: hypothetical protein [unclassified Anabaena]|uniref:hypothetical protein n=1 Tax=unclassified Anabaena TaxID=2619674 RepID=UPI000A51A4F9|nr:MULTISPECIES: hypothetical protein [unclassified Anabaena]
MPIWRIVLKNSRTIVGTGDEGDEEDEGDEGDVACFSYETLPRTRRVGDEGEIISQSPIPSPQSPVPND